MNIRITPEFVKAWSSSYDDFRRAGANIAQASIEATREMAILARKWEARNAVR